MPLTRRAALGAAAAAPAVLRRALAQPDAIPLGALYPLSGALALLGDESFRGLELAVEDRNAAGGLLGRPVRLAPVPTPRSCGGVRMSISRRPSRSAAAARPGRSGR